MNYLLATRNKLSGRIATLRAEGHTDELIQQIIDRRDQVDSWIRSGSVDHHDEAAEFLAMAGCK